MIHLGLKKLEYEITFNKSSYYPFTFNEERTQTKILFGACFGFWWWQNSISLAYRPSETKLDKIDLFAYAYNRGYKSIVYAGQVDIEKKLKIKLYFPIDKNRYGIQVNDDEGNLLEFSDYHVYPFLLAGYEIKRNHQDKVFLKRK